MSHSRESRPPPLPERPALPNSNGVGIYLTPDLNGDYLTTNTDQPAANHAYLSIVPDSGRTTALYDDAFAGAPETDAARSTYLTPEANPYLSTVTDSDRNPYLNTATDRDRNTYLNTATDRDRNTYLHPSDDQ